MTEELSPELVEAVARAIAPRIFYQFDAETMDRAANWSIHCESDQATMRLIARDALDAIAVFSSIPSDRDDR